MAWGLYSRGSPGPAEVKNNEAYKELLSKKQELTQELNSFQEQSKQFKGGGKDAGQGVIPTDTKLNVSLKCNKTQGTVELHLMTSNYSVIRAVIIFAEHLYRPRIIFVYYSCNIRIIFVSYSYQIRNVRIIVVSYSYHIRIISVS